MRKHARLAIVVLALWGAVVTDLGRAGHAVVHGVAAAGKHVGKGVVRVVTLGHKGR